MNRPRILVLNQSCLDVIEYHRDWANQQGIELIAEESMRGLSFEDLIDQTQDCDALIGPMGFPITSKLFDRSPNLKVLSLASSGFDMVDLEAATRTGVVITIAPVADGAEAVADYTWGMLFSIVRRIPHHHRNLQDGDHKRGMGSSVYGKTLGILGLGHIGRAVVRRAVGFDMKVIACECDPNLPFVKEHNIELVPLDELLRRSDFLSIHLRLNPQTREIIGVRELSLMKPTAYLINTARRELVNETALADSLDQRLIAGAATDEVPIREVERLLSHSHHICTPHLGNRTLEGVQAVARCALENAINVLHGKRPQYIVNPRVYDTKGVPQSKTEVPVQ